MIHTMKPFEAQGLKLGAYEDQRPVIDRRLSAKKKKANELVRSKIRE